MGFQDFEILSELRICMKRKVIIFTEYEETYKALRRAFTLADGLEACRFTDDSLRGKNGVVLLAVPDDDKLQELFYEKIRSRHLNPVIVIGFKEKDVFEKEYPLFHDHPYNHSYIRIPFDLSGLIASFENMIPISSKAIRKAICSDSYKGYLLKLLSHDLLKEGKRCEDILNMCGKYLNDKSLSKEIEDAIGKIKKEKDWSAIASDIGKTIEKKIKETRHVRN